MIPVSNPLGVWLIFLKKFSAAFIPCVLRVTLFDPFKEMENLRGEVAFAVTQGVT